MSFYSDLAAVALAKIREFGRDVLLVAPVVTFTDATLTGSVSESTTYSTRGVVEAAKRSMAAAVPEGVAVAFAGSRVVDGEVTVLVPAAPFGATRPEAGWVLYLGATTAGERLRVVDVSALNPGGIPLVYTIGCSR